MKDELIKYSELRCDIFNAASSHNQRMAIFDAAWSAFNRAKKSDLKNITVSVSAEISEPKRDIAASAYREMIEIAKQCSLKDKPVESLAEHEKFAIAVACGVPIEPCGDRNSLVMKMRTRNKIGIVSEPAYIGLTPVTKYVCYMHEQEDAK